MKININNWTLTCKKQYLICDNCIFDGQITCFREYPVLSTLCTTLGSIFIKHSSPDLFNL